MLRETGNWSRVVKRVYLLSVSWLVLLVFCSAGYGLSAPPSIRETSKPTSVDANAVEAVCRLIYRGEFEQAGGLIKESGQAGNPTFSHLAGIVTEYKDIDQHRQTGRQKVYEEQLAELEKLRLAADVNGLNDVNDITKAFSTITKASEIADEQQKKELLANAFAKRVFQEAKTKAAEFEAEGKWLDAYLTCYNWLKVIDKDNEMYSDYAEQLMAKAGIVASFQDSPCETSTERYSGVKKRMFIRAIDALNFYYVNPIDYRQMALEAIERCALLAEVVALSYSEIKKNKSAASLGEDSFFLPDSNQLADWSSGLAEISKPVNQDQARISKDKFMGIFENVVGLNETTVRLPRTVLIAQFVEASLSSLDPYTVMVWPKQVQDFEEMMTNEFTGIGIRISKPKGLLTVASLLPDTPAFNSNLDAGDLIEKVDGVGTKDMSLFCAKKAITGPIGTEVVLTIRRLGEDKADDKVFDVAIIRARVIVPPIRGWQRTDEGKWWYMIDKAHKIGHVHLTSFDTRTVPDFEKILRELEVEGLKGLILDLRNNSGGLLPSAVEIVDKFVKDGTIVSTRPRFGLGTYEWAHKTGTHPDYPLVILINRYSASASEIVAGALQDPRHNRAVLVGERTHGKGSVQGITEHPGNKAQLKYTMAYYHLPSGQRVESRETMEKLGRDDWGIGPDIRIKLSRDEFKKLDDMQWDNLILAKAGHDNGAVPLKKHTSEELLAADPQLAVAILVIKTKLIEAASKVN